MKTSSIIGVFVMMVGLVAAVLLAQKSQDLRERADEEKENKIKICHKTGSDSNPWEQIEVADKAAQPHVDHGDIIGDCPSNEAPAKDLTNPLATEPTKPLPVNPTSPPVVLPTDRPVVISSPTATSAPVGGSSGGAETGGGGKKSEGQDSGKQSNNSDSTTVTNTTVSSNSSKKITPINENSPVSPETIENSLSFTISFFGIDTFAAGKTISIKFFRSGVEGSVLSTGIVSNSTGVYTGSVSGFEPGTYDLAFSSNGHLTKIIRNINLLSGKNTWFWPNTKLIAGDINADNILNATDFALFLAEYDGISKPVESSNSYMDYNADGLINLPDVNIILRNYN